VLEVFGQPKAWVDSIMASWISDFIRGLYPQCLVFADCLCSRWSTISCVSHWANQQMLIPYAPDVTSFLQEPDTHEHSQIKAGIRREKAAEHFELERQNPGNAKLPWGPGIMVRVLSRVLRGFKEKNPQCPLLGMIQNQMLIYRPTNDGRLLLLDAHPCSEQLSAAGCHRLPPGRGIPMAWVKERVQRAEAWVNGVPPDPEWEQLEGEGIPSYLHHDDLEAEPEGEEDMFEMDVADLGLSDEQKKMLLPPDVRMREMMVEGSGTVRAEARRRASTKRRNKWAAKFGGHFLGKSAAKWKERANAEGLATARGRIVAEAMKAAAKRQPRQSQRGRKTAGKKAARAGTQGACSGTRLRKRLWGRRRVAKGKSRRAPAAGKGKRKKGDSATAVVARAADWQMVPHRAMVSSMFGRDGVDMAQRIAAMQAAQVALGLAVLDLGAVNQNEVGEPIFNQCLYLSMAESYYVSGSEGVEAVRELALLLKRVIEKAVLDKHPDWAGNRVGEDVQAVGDFLGDALASNDLLSELSVAIFDSVSGIVETYVGPSFPTGDEEQRSRLLTIQYVPGHYVALVVKNGCRPSLLQLRRCLAEHGVTEVATNVERAPSAAPPVATSSTPPAAPPVTTAKATVQPAAKPEANPYL